MKKILISSPRCGSTVGQRYYEEDGIKCSDLFGWHEFFLDAPHGIRKPLEWKVDFIETLDCNFHYKLHAFHLFYGYKDGILYDWFKEFYNETEVVVLKRKDTWRAYISLLVHHTLGRKHNWHKYSVQDEEDLEKICTGVSFKYNEDLENAFKYQQQCLNAVEGDVIYLEDQDYTEKMKWEIDYERFIRREELELLRANFSSVSERFYEEPSDHRRG